MELDTVAHRVGTIIGELFGTPATRILRETVAHDIDGWDSLSHVYVILEVERAFGIRFPLERVHDMKNVGELVDIVTGLLSKRL